MPVVVKLCLTFQCLRREANPDPAATWFCLLSALANWSLVWPWQDIGSPATSKATGANSAAGKKPSVQKGQLTLIIHEVVGSGEPGAYGNARGSARTSTRRAQLTRQGTQDMCRKKALTLQNTISPPNSPGNFSQRKRQWEFVLKHHKSELFLSLWLVLLLEKKQSLTALNCSELGTTVEYYSFRTLPLRVDIITAFILKKSQLV